MHDEEAFAELSAQERDELVTRFMPLIVRDGRAWSSEEAYQAWAKRQFDELNEARALRNDNTQPLDMSGNELWHTVPMQMGYAYDHGLRSTVRSLIYWVALIGALVVLDIVLHVFGVTL